MNNLNDLKTIWLTAKTDNLPSSVEMLHFIKKFRNQKLVKKIVSIVLACLLAVLMLAIIFMYRSALLTTRIGEILILMASLILARTNIRSIKRFYMLQECSNKDFLQFIEQTRQNQIYYYQKTQFIGLLLCSAGLPLYLYEMVYQNRLLLIIVYALVIVYLLILWLVIRPRIFKKGIDELNATRERLEKILNQLN